MFLEFLLHAPTLGNIARNSHRADDVSVSVCQRQLGGEDPALASIRPCLLLLLLEDRLSGADHLLLIGKRLLCMFLAKHVKIGLVDCLGKVAQSEVLCHGMADADKAALAVLEIHMLRNVFQEGMEQVLRRAPNHWWGAAFVVRRHSVQTLVVMM